ncbi:hypothetical protein HY468_04840 [Candidatus Roizmanbacteria bacterium]|nr:hypothetical protein [Candidatus Roizmanbacteria bacterium]
MVENPIGRVVEKGPEGIITTKFYYPNGSDVEGGHPHKGWTGPEVEQIVKGDYQVVGVINVIDKE